MGAVATAELARARRPSAVNLPAVAHPRATLHESSYIDPVISFVLYIAGDTVRSQRAIANLRRIGEERFGGRYKLSIIDVHADPVRAERDRILTTPTLIKQSPGAARRVTGDLTDFDQVLLALSLVPDGEA